MNIPGFPEGLLCTRIGVAKDDEFEVYGTSPDSKVPHVIRKGPRPGSTSQIIVAADKGYQIRPAQFDIRAYEPTFQLVKVLDAPETIELHVKFTVENAADRDVVEEALAKLKDLPGYVDPAAAP